MIQTKINHHVFKTKVANNSESIQHGMMGKKFDKTFDAMLFLVGLKYNPDPYNGSVKTVNDMQNFWMKNCIIPLDMIFIKDNKITTIHHDCPPCSMNNCAIYSGIADAVLEVQGGTCKMRGIYIGDSVHFVII